VFRARAPLASNCSRATAASGPSVSVRPSLLPNAGLGLFAARAFEADAVVPGCTYGGDALTLMEARRREDKAYLMALHFNVHVDASDATCLGYLARYVNDAEAELSETRSDDTKTRGDVAEGSKKNNAAFAKDPERRLARLRTTRAVAEGEELTAAYGAQYWRLKAAKG
jgi:hypothetical protein